MVCAADLGTFCSFVILLHLQVPKPCFVVGFLEFYRSLFNKTGLTRRMIMGVSAKVEKGLAMTL